MYLCYVHILILINTKWVKEKCCGFLVYQIEVEEKIIEIEHISSLNNYEYKTG
jgi:hypothetical protein